MRADTNTGNVTKLGLFPVLPNYQYDSISLHFAGNHLYCSYHYDNYIGMVKFANNETTNEIELTSYELKVFPPCCPYALTADCDGFFYTYEHDNAYLQKINFKEGTVTSLDIVNERYPESAAYNVKNNQIYSLYPDDGVLYLTAANPRTEEQRTVKVY